MAGTSRRPVRPGSDSTSVLPRVGLALVISLVMGLLLAALAFPVIGGLGLTAKSGADDFLALPTDLETGPPPTRSKVLAADGSLLATFYLQNRVRVPLSSVPLQTRQALIAIEDSRFYAHHGVDFKGVARAALTNAGAGGVRQGASTLTQQYVKNALIESATTKAQQNAAKADNIERKLREARYAMALERKLTKDQILERYLNIAYYGHGVYGVGTAANYYFGKPVNRLTLAESALLAGMVQNPTLFDPSSKVASILSLTRTRRDTVLRRMSDLHFISDSERVAAEDAPIATKVHPVDSGCDSAAVTAPFFCDYLAHVLEDTPEGAALGATREARQRTLLGGGLIIKTTLDPKVQQAAQKAVDGQIPRTDPSGAAAAIDVVEPGTGNLRAMAVNRTYSDAAGRANTKVNYATGGHDGFQAGSTFKAFVLAGALRQGIPLSLTLYAPQKYSSKVFQDVQNGVVTPYTLQNAGDSEAGTFNLVQATELSVNTYYVQLEERTGVAKPAALAESMGVHAVQSYVADQPLQAVPSFVLGVNGVSPLDMAQAYATFAAHGRYCPTQVITSIVGPDGKPLPLPDTQCEQVLEPGIADTVTSVLRGVIDGPEPLRTGLHASIGRPAAGKTGTVDHSKSAWFIGYTPQLAAAVWVGQLDSRGVPQPMQNVTIDGRYYKQVYGGDIPAAIWRDAMSGALQGVPPQDFAPADAAVAQGSKTAVPDVSGQTYDAAAQMLTDAGFAPLRGRTVAAAPTPAGIVPYTYPRAGTPATAGTTVIVYVSNGAAPPPPPPPPPSPVTSPQPATSPSPAPKPGPSKKGRH